MRELGVSFEHVCRRQMYCSFNHQFYSRQLHRTNRTEEKEHPGGNLRLCRKILQPPRPYPAPPSLHLYLPPSRLAANILPSKATLEAQVGLGAHIGFLKGKCARHGPTATFYTSFSHSLSQLPSLTACPWLIWQRQSVWRQPVWLLKVPQSRLAPCRPGIPPCFPCTLTESVRVVKILDYGDNLSKRNGAAINFSGLPS